MNNRPLPLNLFIVLVLFGLMTVFAPAVMAQEATADVTNQVFGITPTVPVPVDVNTEGGDVTIITGDSTPNATPVEAPKSILSSILEFALGAIVGAGVMLGSAAAWIRSAMNDPVKMTLAETAARSISPEVFKQMLDFLDTSRAFVVEASDGVPMITKQPPPASLS